MDHSRLRIARVLPDEIAERRRAEASDDVAAIVQAFRPDGVLISDDDAYEAWRRFSDTHSAGWLALYDNPADIRARLLPFLEVEEG